MPTLNKRGGAPSYRSPLPKWCRASRSGTRCNQQFVRGAVDERQFSKNQEGPIPFSEATMNVSRDQSRVHENAGFGNECHVRVYWGSG